MRVKHSPAKIRDYVERELDRTVRAHYPNFKVYEGAWGSRNEDLDKPRTRKQLFWTIEGQIGRWPGDYVIEARVKDGEILIWFGYTSAGAGGTRHIVVPAVHLSLQHLVSAENQFRDDGYSLGAVLEWMLTSRERSSHENSSDMYFPMNNRILT